MVVIRRRRLISMTTRKTRRVILIEMKTKVLVSVMMATATCIIIRLMYCIAWFVHIGFSFFG
jgi:hypothetical protein